MAEEKLIEAVRAHIELYDTNNANYTKTKLKKKIWNEIAVDLNLKNGIEAKTQWLKLRGSYRDARRRQLRCMKSGAAPEDIKQWRYQNQMSFLEPFMSTGAREGNSNDSDDDSHFLPATSLSEEHVDCQEVEWDSAHQSVSRDLSDYVDNEFIPPNNYTPPAHSRVSRKRKHVEEVQYLMKGSLEQREEEGEDKLVLGSNDHLRDDPLYNFFISMYQSTKQMPPKYQHKVKNQLFQAVSQAEEEIINIPNRPLSSSN